MTEKQENILKAALKLFAEEGYNATSTSKVAKEAGVSEGLIFRHFTNKEGLLNAIIKLGGEKAKELYSTIIFEPNPQVAIAKAIDMPFDVAESEHEFWQLQFKLKWELKEYNATKMEPILLCLKNAFEKLNYANPDLEAEILLLTIDGIASALLKNTIKDKTALQNFIKYKYKV